MTLRVGGPGARPGATGAHEVVVSSDLVAFDAVPAASGDVDGAVWCATAVFQRAVAAGDLFEAGCVLARMRRLAENSGHAAWRAAAAAATAAPVASRVRLVVSMRSPFACRTH